MPGTACVTCAMSEKEKRETTRDGYNTSSTPDLQAKPYTKEQLEAVQRIKSSGLDYYRILLVEKTATESEIKKSYRKVIHLSRACLLDGPPFV